MSRLKTNCTPPIASWYDWQHSEPIDPLDLFANAQLVMGSTTDQGVFVDSTTYSIPPTPPSLLKIVGGRIINTTGPTVLASLQNPISTLVTGTGNSANRIEIDFNQPPKASTVTTTSFRIVSMTAGLVGGTTVSLPVSTTARLDLPAALPAATYGIQLNGTSSPAILDSPVSGTALDGEAIALPSGDGVAGGDFLFGLSVITGTQPIPGAAPALHPQSYWNTSQIAITSPPVCVALETTNNQMVADAAQWTFRHLTAILGPLIPVPLNKSLYVRFGLQWQMNIPLSLGYLSYSELLISLLSNVTTRGDCQGTVPAILFNNRTYSGNVTLQITLKKLGTFGIGIRAIDTNGYYSMFSSTLNVVE